MKRDLQDQMLLVDMTATEYVRQIKEAKVRVGRQKGNRLSCTFKLDRNAHGEVLAALGRHGMTLTDLLTHHIAWAIPTLRAAEPVDVPGYEIDQRNPVSKRLHRRPPKT